MSLFFIFFLKLPVWSLALAFSLSITINVIILTYLLFKRIKGLDFRLVVFESSKILLTTFLSSFFVYWEMKILDGLIFDTSRTINVFLLLVTGGISFSVLYFFLAWIFNVKEFQILNRILHKARGYRKKVVEIYTQVE